MKKYSFVLPLLTLISTPAFADGFYKYKGGETCVLKKFANKVWSEADASGIEGSAFPIQLSRANPNAAVFAVKGTTYGTRKDCLEETDAPAGAVATTGANKAARKMFVEGRLSFLVMGGGASTVTSNGATFTTQKYSPSVELSGRFGYPVSWWTPRDNLFGEVGYFSGSQNSTLNTTVIGANSEKILSIDIGYQHYFDMRGKFTPFASFALGWDHLSGTTAFTSPTGSSTGGYTYSASGIGEYIEAGTLYTLNQKWQLNGSLSYHLMSFSPTVSDSNVQAIVPIGSAAPLPVSHNNLGINLGVRYTL